MSTSMSRASIVVALAAAAALVACKPSEKKRDSEDPRVKGGYKPQTVCKVVIARKALPPVEAQGESPVDVEAAKAEAWKQACAKLPADVQATCRNEGKWVPTVSTGSASAGGKVTYQATVKLAENPPEVAIGMQSDLGAEEACEHTIAKACEKAGAKADCVKSGEYVLKSKTSEEGEID